MESPTKKCIQCKQTKPIYDFKIHSKSKDGRTKKCKECSEVIRSDNKDQNRESYLAKRYPDGVKKCKSCELEKPLAEYGKFSKLLDGLNSRCKVCESEYRRGFCDKYKNRSLEEMTMVMIETFGDLTNATKKCITCKEHKGLREFSLCKASYVPVNDRCISCVREVSSRFHDKVVQLKSNLREGKSCEHCGFDRDVRCLDFAHYNREGKTTNDKGNTISPSNLTYNQLLKEVDKTRFLCRNCHALETYIESNSDLSRTYDAIRTREKKAELRGTVNSEKSRRGKCIDCNLDVNGIFHMFDFDHVPGCDKIAAIATMVTNKRPIKEIEEEMKKCELRCKNCHWIITLQRDTRNNVTKKSVLDKISHLIN